MSTLVLTSNTLAVTAGAGQIEYDGQFFATDSNASRGQVERITRGTAVASTSGTSIDFTGIPAWAKKITVMFDSVSLSATNLSNPIIQIGLTTPESTGYVASSTYVGGTNQCATSVITNGFPISMNTTAANSFSGIATICNLSGNTWVYSGVFTDASLYSRFGGGTKTTSGVIDRVRITTQGGTNAFDAGSINIMYEG